MYNQNYEIVPVPNRAPAMTVYGGKEGLLRALLYPAHGGSEWSA